MHFSLDYINIALHDSLTFFYGIKFWSRSFCLKGHVKREDISAFKVIITILFPNKSRFSLASALRLLRLCFFQTLARLIGKRLSMIESNICQKIGDSVQIYSFRYLYLDYNWHLYVIIFCYFVSIMQKNLTAHPQILLFYSNFNILDLFISTLGLS